MQHIQLSVSIREQRKKGGARKTRAAGKVPGIIYGKGYENILIEADPKEVEKVFSGTAGTNALLQLQIGGKDSLVAMLKDYQADILTRKFTHLDFVKLDLTKKIRVEVPIHFVGKAEGVKEGGIMEVIRRELPVICLPTAIPKDIEVDVSALKVGDSIHINDLKLKEGVEVPHDVNFVLVAVVAPQAEEVAAAPAEGAPAEPEVLTAKKPAEGEDAKKSEGKSDKK